MLANLTMRTTFAFAMSTDFVFCASRAVTISTMMAMRTTYTFAMPTFHMFDTIQAIAIATVMAM
jgi:hypothetical protein